MTSYDDALAALRDHARRHDESHRDERPHFRKLDSGVSIEAPGPRTLARVWGLPLLLVEAEHYRSGQTLLVRPHGAEDEPEPVALADVADRLREALLSLPDRSDAGRPYNDVRRLIRDADPATVRAYLLGATTRDGKVRRGAAQYVRILADEWHPPKVETEDRKRYATEDERRAGLRRSWRAASHRYRESIREDERPDLVIAASWLLAWRQGVGPSYTIERAELLDQYRDWIDEAQRSRPNVDPVGRNRLYALAVPTIGQSRRRSSGAVYVTPETPVDLTKEQRLTIAEDIVDQALERGFRMTDRDELLADELLDRIARVAWQEERDTLLHVLERRRGLSSASTAATGTDGRLIDLESRRRR